MRLIGALERRQIENWGYADCAWTYSGVEWDLGGLWGLRAVGIERMF